MRSCTLDGDPALAIYITKTAMFRTHSASSVNKAVWGSGLGKTQDKRAYLKPGCMDHIRGKQCQMEQDLAIPRISSGHLLFSLR